MDFSTYIKFSKDLIENQETTITYSGYLFENNSQSLKIVYGFGDNWMYSGEKEMEKTENGFTANIKMLNFSKFNFCFKNNNNEWDNNYQKNFSAEISEQKINEQFILNENVIEEILTNLAEADLSQVNYEKQTLLNDILSNQPTLCEEISEGTSEEACEEIFEETPENNVESNISEITPVTKDDQNSSTTTDLSELFEPVTSTPDFSELFDYVEEEQNEKEEENTEDDNFDDEYEKKSEDFTGLEKNKDNSVDTVVTDIIDDLYENSKKASAEEESSLIEELKADDNSPVAKENALIVSPRALTRYYLVKKKIKVAVYKLFITITRNRSKYNENTNK